MSNVNYNVVLMFLFNFILLRVEKSFYLACHIVGLAKKTDNTIKIHKKRRDLNLQKGGNQVNDFLSNAAVYPNLI